MNQVPDPPRTPTPTGHERRVPDPPTGARTNVEPSWTTAIKSRRLMLDLSWLSALNKPIFEHVEVDNKNFARQRAWLVRVALTQPDRPAPARGGYDLAATADHREFWRVEGRAERGSGSARRELR